jgi:glycerol-3-phosphate dehydrogenase (NAD(P)+)
MPKHFSILGDGSWGTAIALLLAEHADYEVTLWSARAENARLLQQTRENKQFLPGIPIPQLITLTSNESEATSQADLLIAAIPTVYLRSTLKRFSPLAGDQPVLSLSKGLEINTFARPTEIIRDVLGSRRVGALSGPSHAEEVAKGLPTTIVAASDDMDFARWVQGCLTSKRFRVYTNRDLVGVELAGALKNIVGIAAGISDGLGFGDNAKSALLTRAVVEMARFGVALGAEQQTFFGLAGMGDLMTTCISPHGRNRHVGERLAKGEKLSEILATMTMVAEGIFTTRSVHDKAALMGIDMPITTEVYRVLYEDKDPRTAVLDLMTREPKLE